MQLAKKVLRPFLKAFVANQDSHPSRNSEVFIYYLPLLMWIKTYNKMSIAIVLHAEASVAVRARVRFLLCVRPHVYYKVGVLLQQTIINLI